MVRKNGPLFPTIIPGKWSIYAGEMVHFPGEMIGGNEPFPRKMVGGNGPLFATISFQSMQLNALEHLCLGLNIYTRPPMAVQTSLTEVQLTFEWKSRSHA